MADGTVPNELKQAFTKFEEASAALQAKNDQRLVNVEKKFDDVVTKDELKNVGDALIELKTAFNEEFAKLQRARVGDAASEQKQRITAHGANERAAFDDWFRTGDDAGLKANREAGIKLAAELGLKDLHGVEIKDLNSVIAQDGGYLVEPEREADMIDILTTTSAMRQVARVREIGKKELEIPVNKGGANAAWTPELAERIRTLTSQIEMVKFGVDEIYALPLATLTILEDGEFDVEEFLHEETVEAMDRAENAAFVAGDGNKKPKGFTTYDKVANASWAWGKHGYITTGASGAFLPSFPGASPSTASQNGADCLFNLIYAFHPSLRGNLNWAMNTQTLLAFRKLKDGDGKYVTREFFSEDRGIITSILGYGVEEFGDMEDIGADKFAAALGDFHKGYQILDRVGLQVRRDEISHPGNVVFHFRKRVGGGARDFQAIKFLKFGTS